ncbi:hypothetical protein F8237_01690 [Bradyrhizobium betae]|uniref:Uncharacterized protein n=2 Tax=Bradyrhizobium betae TaxID=244734 RepID=A0A5P6PFI0_9BRAD|nr:hypothetical protein [Bradyrhizobium betae]QFI77046.1 hypothetical protein F8237_01690 [Bradyrhizobium betae]
MDADDIRAIVRETLAEERRIHNEAADDVMLKTVSAILTSFGIEEDDRKEFKKDLQHLRNWRLSVDQAQTITFKAIVTCIVTGMIGAIWLGFKTVVTIKGGG